MRCLILFSPALVLLAMTAVTVIDDGISKDLLKIFLAMLTVAAVAAEVVRINLRREARDHRERPIR